MWLLAKIFLFLLPFQWALPVLGEDIPLLRVFALVLVLLFLVKLLGENPLPLPPIIFFGLLLSWFLSLLLSLFLAGDWTLGLRKFVFLINLFSLVFIWYALGTSREKRQILLEWLIKGGMGAALIGLTFFAAPWFWGVARVFHFLVERLLPFFLGERLTGIVAANASLLVNIGGETWLRVTAFFPDPHVAAFFFGITACLSLGLFLETQKRFWLIGAILLLLADLLTFSRGGYIGLLGASFIFLFFLPSKTWPGKLLLLFMAFFPLFFWFGMPIFERFVSAFTLADASSTDRLLLWQTAWDTWLTHPLFGVGLGNYAEWIHPGVGATLPYYAHNLYLDVIVEIGVVGLIFFLGLIGYAVQRVWQEARSGGIALGVLAALVLYLTHSLFETALFSVPVTILLTLLLAFSLPKAENSL